VSKLFAGVLASGIAIVALAGQAQHPNAVSTSSSPRVHPQPFVGTWQGVWHGYGVVTHNDKAAQNELSLTVQLKAAADGSLSGATWNSGYRPQPAPEPKPVLALGAPPRTGPPPPPPLPLVPPAGPVLHPRIEGRTLAFQVNRADGKPVEFRLTLEGPDTGSLQVVLADKSRVYPQFQMTRAATAHDSH
jgi:hypothetical protein